MNKTLHATISGRVQGVWYRGWTVDQARGRGLVGWVRNRRDGTVEAVFVGPVAAVDEMIGACWRGPPAARVDAVEVRELETAPVEMGSRFDQRPTV